MQLYRRKSEDLQIEKLLAGSKRPHPLHDDYCSARAFAVNPSRLHQAQDQAAQGRDLSSLATLRASGVDCSARPSKESYHAMNADTCLVCSRPTSSDRKKARKISLRRKISLTRGASYKPPALPGDTYLCFHTDQSPCSLPDVGFRLPTAHAQAGLDPYLHSPYPARPDRDPRPFGVGRASNYLF